MNIIPSTEIEVPKQAPREPEFFRYRIVVTGSRLHKDQEWVWEQLDRIHKRVDISMLGHGSAQGVDRWAADWCRAWGVQEVSFPVNRRQWAEGKHMGHARNGLMLGVIKPDLVVAFPWGDARGTENCILQATKAGIHVEVCKHPDDPGHG